MESPNKGTYLFVAFTLLALCVTALLTIIFVALWQYKEMVAWLVLIVATVAILLPTLIVCFRQLDEQSLRHERYRYREELPLDRSGRPLYLPEETKEWEHPY
ncbi:MAG: hypothetical protein M3Z08_10480 [Chloroflexota bacterium]|nr:hypothetical protein [Chloroflexota bacterium]